MIIRILLIIFLIPLTSHGQSKINKQYSYLALGDSYTIGESVEENDRWPVQLANNLSKIKKPKIIAKTGWTTYELIDTLNKIDLKKYDYVSLLIGVNNQYRGNSIKNFKSDFKLLLKKSIDYAYGNKENVFVVSIPDWGVTPFAKNRNKNLIKREINSFNRVIKRECKKNNVAYFNITKISRNAQNDLTLLADDGLHPSKIMYKQWVEIIKPYFNNY